MTSGASGSFSTNSPASPLSSVSLTSPLSPFSPVPGSQASPTKQLCPEVSTGHTKLGTNPNPKPGTDPCSDSTTNPDVCKSPKPCLNSYKVPHFKTDPKPRNRPKSYTDPDTSLHAENINYYGCETHEHTFPQISLAFQEFRQSLGRLDPVIEETDQDINYRTNYNFGQAVNPSKAIAGDQISFLQVQRQDSKYTNQHSDTVSTNTDIQEVSQFTSNLCSQEVKVGIRKDLCPDSHPYHFSSDDFRYLSCNKCFSMPESQILFLQDSYQTDVLSLCYSPDLNTPSVPCFRSASSESYHHRQLASLPLCHVGEGARPLTYPNNQGGLGFAPVICAVTQSYSPSNHHMFLQAHLWRKGYPPLHSWFWQFWIASILICKILNTGAVFSPRSNILPSKGHDMTFFPPFCSAIGAANCLCSLILI